jgi:hypothetical protein
MPQPLTQAICDRARCLSAVHSQRDVAKILRVSRSSLHHMKGRGWRAAVTTHPFRARPTDFAIQERHCSVDELCRHYGTSTRVIRRWRRELRG